MLYLLIGLVIGFVVAATNHISMMQWVNDLRNRAEIAEDRLYCAWRDGTSLVVPERGTVKQTQQESAATTEQVELHHVLESIVAEWDSAESQAVVRAAFENLKRQGFSDKVIVEKYLGGEIEGVNPQGPPI